jgi:predicted Fe-Mo cluster-binding NifX family protein
MEQNEQKLAVSAYAGRVAPLFDASEKVELFGMTTDGPVSAGALSLPATTPQQRAAVLDQHGVGTLICGAVSGYAEQMITARGIHVIPWVHGAVQEILRAYVSGSLDRPMWAMPGALGRGFGRRRGRGRGRGRGGGPGRGRTPYGPPFRNR